MNADDVSLEEMLGEYTDWIKSHSSVQKLSRWTEITVPFLDHSGDHFQFYARVKDGRLYFDDDGYTLHGIESSGFTLRGTRAERVEQVARRFGVVFAQDGSLTMELNPNESSGGMNDFIQALVHVDSLVEVANHRTTAYFADDVAEALRAQHVFYTPNVGIRGKSLYSSTFDFMFQETEHRHNTVLAEAPNRFDRTAVATIMFAWNDVRETNERRGATLLVFIDDRDKSVNSDAKAALAQYEVDTMPFADIPSEAHQKLAV